MTLSDSKTKDSATPLPRGGNVIPFDPAQISADAREDGGRAASFASGGKRLGWEGFGRAEVIRAWEDGVRLSIEGSSTKGWCVNNNVLCYTGWFRRHTSQNSIIKDGPGLT